MGNQFLGRADTATQLETPRTIFSQSFDGTANIGGQALVYGKAVDTHQYSYGALQIREADLIGNTQTTDKYAPRVSFHWANRTGANLYMTSSGSFKVTTGNDERLTDIYAREFIGALSGNATSATTATTATSANKWTTARTLTLSGNASGSVSFDGSANMALNITNHYATGSDSSNWLNVPDTRGTNPAPSALTRSVRFEFKGHATINNPYGNDTYNGLMSAAFYSDASGGNRYQIAFGSNMATIPYLSMRTNPGGATSWGDWKLLPTMSADSGFWGFDFPSNNTYLRTPPDGLLPNAASSSGLGYVGTSVWPFLAMYAKKFYGDLSGNAATATNASNLAYFKCTSSTNVGVDDVTANAIGYVSGIGLLGASDGGLFKQVYSSVRAGEIFIDYRTGGLATRGKNNGTWTAWNNIVRNTINSIPQPIGGEYITNAQYTTGALQIKLPVGYTSSMLRFTVDIFDYATNQSCTYNIAGYNYGSSSSWVNCSAYSHGYFNTNFSNLTVNFCKTGTTPCVCIGDVGTRWDYVQVKVRDVFVGYSGYTYAFQQGWGISFVTTMPTVQTTVANPANWYNAYNAVTAGSATNATQLGGVAAANYINTSDTLILRGTV